MFDFKRLILLFSIMFMGVVGVKAAPNYYIVFVDPSKLVDEQCSICKKDLSKSKDQLLGTPLKLNYNYNKNNGVSVTDIYAKASGFRCYKDKDGVERWPNSNYDYIRVVLPLGSTRFFHQGDKRDFYFMVDGSDKHFCLDCIFNYANSILFGSSYYDPDGEIRYQFGINEKAKDDFFEYKDMKYLEFLKVGELEYGENTLAKVGSCCHCDDKFLTHTESGLFGKEVVDEHIGTCDICKQLFNKESHKHTSDEKCMFCHEVRSSHTITTCPKCGTGAHFGCAFLKNKKCPKCNENYELVKFYIKKNK